MLDAAFAAAEVEGHVRSHRRPAQARTGTDGGIHVLDARQSGDDCADRLPPQSGLQPVGQMSAGFFADVDRLLADLAIEREGPGDRFGGGLLAADDLDQRYQMRWIERMATDQARRGPEPGLHLSHDQARAPGGENGVWTQRGVELCIEL